jgi:lipopolysaccharide/colanic/teichoic acid biosynthesis glycosyltransferase
LGIAAAAALAVLLVALLLASEGAFRHLPRALPVAQWLALTVLACGARLAAMARRPRPRSEAPVLLIGAGEAAHGLIQLLLADGSAYAVAGILDGRPAWRGRTLHGVPVLGSPGDLPEAVARLAMHGVAVGAVVVAEPLFEGREGEAALAGLEAAARDLSVPVLSLSGFLRLHAARLRPGAPGSTQASFSGKRLVDLVLAASALVLTLPTFLLVAALVALCHGRPVLFGQVRPGYAMRPIRVLKFRTMRFSLSPTGELAADEERLTVLGRILRRTRLDELPQLWNVLKGDMSLIGPRPLLPKDLPAVDALLPERFSVRPGITGLAQINGGDLLSPEEKLAFDLWYVRHRGLWLDLKIALLTLWTMVAGDRARFADLGLPRP